MSTPSTSAPSLAAGSAVVPSPQPRSRTSSPSVIPSVLDERLAALAHALRDAREVALLPECLVRIRSHPPPFAGSIAISPGPSVTPGRIYAIAFDHSWRCTRGFCPALSHRHRVSLQERRDRSSDRLGALHLQEMPRAVDRAVLDARERSAEELGDLHPQWPGLGTQHDKVGRSMAAACSTPKVHSVRAGSSIPKKVSASLVALAPRRVPAPRAPLDTFLPVEPACGRTDEHRYRSTRGRRLLYASNTGVADRSRMPARPASDTERRLQQSERLAPFSGVVEQPLGCRSRAAGVP